MHPVSNSHTYKHTHTCIHFHTVMCRRFHVSTSVSVDTQIKEENFLEDIGNLLNTGEVPNMFPIDEKNEICSKMRQIDK